MAEKSKKTRAIAAEIKRACLARRARQLSRTITRIFDEALRPVGVTSSQLTILVAIVANPGARASDLHRMLEIEQSSFSRNASLMEKRGWIDKQPCDGDRGQNLMVTKDGAALMAQALPHWRSAQREAKRLLGGNAQTFVDLVDEQLLA